MLNKEYGLLIAFEDQSPSYTHGFEAGMIYQEMQNQDRIEKTIHTENLAQIEKMAQKLGFRFMAAPIPEYDEWAHVQMERVIRRVK